jgi:heat shock protein HslJ
MSRPWPMRYAPLVLVVLLAAAGCGNRTEPGAPDADALRGRTFTSAEFPPHPLVAGTRIELRFTDDGRLVANAGCNTMGGTISLAGGKLDVADLSITEMGCDPPRHEQDQRLSAFLDGKPSWRLDGEHLALGSAGTELTLAEVKALPLVGTTWRADTLIQGAVAGSTPAGVGATLVFGQDEVTVSGLCNLRTAKYQAAGSTVTFQLGPLTRRACAPEIMTVEQAAVALLDGEATYRIDGRTLTITKGDKGLRCTAA